MTWLRRLPLLGRLFGPRLSGPAYYHAVDELVERFRQFGLLAGLQPHDLLQRFQQEWRRPFDPSNRFDRPWLVAMDARHVWMDDTEADVCAENQVYAEFLRALAAISTGSFDPQSIAEVWDSDEGPINVSFTLAGARHAVHPAYSDDWMDLDILASINTLLSTHQFACWGMDQTAIVVCLPRDALEAFKSSELLPLEWLCE